MKHYVKLTQEKQPAQIIIQVGTNDIPHNKNSDKIANETTENNVVVSSITSRKEQFNNKTREVNGSLKDKYEEHNLHLIQHHNINPFCYTNAKGLHLNK